MIIFRRMIGTLRAFLKFSVKSDNSFASNSSKTARSLSGMVVGGAPGGIDLNISGSNAWLKYSEVCGPLWPV